MLHAIGIASKVLAGTEHVRIMQRAGHQNFSTTLGYVREAEGVGLAAGEPFPALPELSQESPQGPAEFYNQPDSLNVSASPTGFEPVLQP